MLTTKDHATKQSHNASQHIPTQSSNVTQNHGTIGSQRGPNFVRSMTLLDPDLNLIWLKTEANLVGLFWNCFKTKVTLFYWVFLEVKGDQSEAKLQYP